MHFLYFIFMIMSCKICVTLNWRECWFIDTWASFIFTFSGGFHGRNPTLILTKSLQDLTGMSWTGNNASEKIQRNTWITLGKMCTQKAREDHLFSQMTATLGISVTQTRRISIAGGHHLIVMWWAMITEGFPRSRVMEEEKETDAERGLESTSRVLRIEGGRRSRLLGWQGKNCRRHQGLTQTTSRESRGWAGGGRSRAEDEGDSETSVQVWGQMTKEGGQAGTEEGGTHRVLVEADKERSHIKRGPPPLKGNGEKWMTAVTLGKFKAKDFAALSQGKRKRRMRRILIFRNFYRAQFLTVNVPYFP